MTADSGSGPATAPTSPPDGAPADETDARLNAVEAEQQRQGGILQQILAKVSGSAPAAPAPAQQVTEDRLEPGSVVAEVIAELGRRDQAAAQETERETLAQRVAKLEEKPPEPPVRKVEHVMWGPR